jgi:hypothetical protein
MSPAHKIIQDLCFPDWGRRENWTAACQIIDRSHKCIQQGILSTVMVRWSRKNYWNLFLQTIWNLITGDASTSRDSSLSPSNSWLAGLKKLAAGKETLHRTFSCREQNKTKKHKSRTEHILIGTSIQSRHYNMAYQNAYKYKIRNTGNVRFIGC